jgi:hypothetical protein
MLSHEIDPLLSIFIVRDYIFSIFCASKFYFFENFSFDICLAIP